MLHLNTSLNGALIENILNPAGATPVDPKQNGKPATVKQDWWGIAPDSSSDMSALQRHSTQTVRHRSLQHQFDGSCSTQQPGTAGSAGGQHHWYADHNSIEGKEGQLDREERLRILREKQNEDRQRKLDELKQQALAAQKFREQKEEERRRRLEELRMRDTDRRHQVEERKRQIWEAERDRREAILRKNQEREARIESKRKNERSSIVFAFGSSTPRMLEPGDTGSSYWASRRATSTTNVMTLSLTTAASPGGPLTRRSSERELDGSGSKKRAASAGGIDRKIHHDPLRMTSSSIYEVFQWGGDDDYSPHYSHKAVIDRNESFLYRNDEMDGVTGAVSTVACRNAGRKKTDLTPTVPQSASREAVCSPTPGTRTPRSAKTHPGRAYSMSRLDVLAAPRRPKLTPPPPVQQQPSLRRTAGGGVPSVYRSMSVLPGTGGSATTSKLGPKGAVQSRSMLQLGGGGPIPPPRPTRAEKLRRKAREQAAAAARSPSGDHHSPGLRSGEMTPSRPQSSMSQHSVTSQLSTASASLRSRSATTPRKPRPVSIAVTGITSPADKGLVKSPSVGGVGTDRPPLPKVHSSKKSSNTATSSTNATAAKTEHPKKQSADKAKPTKTSTVNTPKATPVHSPLVESGESTTSSISNEPKSQIETNVETVTTTVTAEGTPKEEEPQKEPPQTQPIEEIIPQKEPVLQEEGTQPPQPKQEIITEQPQETPQQQQQQQPQPPNAANTTSVNQPTQQLENGNTELPDTEMTSSMIAKIRITTEEEAKAALAERRRLAREQAEREAELERQRLEAERLAEEERLRKEEEEQRRMEEEQLRLLEEARVAEELRLKQAIEEAQKREEEERKRKEEELKLKLEKEEAEKKAKEEAEKMRLEMEQRLKKEEEDRQARRKRVEAIMLRTRGKGGMSTTTPTKDGEESEENSPADEARKMTESVTSVSSEHDQFLHSERSHSDANNSMSSMKTSQSTMEQLNNKHNGHHNGSYHTVAQNNVTNSLLVSLGTESVGQILDVPGGKIPQDQPQFIPQFQEKKEPHTVNDLLS
ncbi:uncharacterized protein isoform X9 [Rhodnius prolixus]|uniref:uncharacterized protein isoform X9 n=1 Tax=Rhodnius prolixus TaxID=13249 RepID=UPI003D187CBC